MAISDLLENSSGIKELNLRMNLNFLRFEGGVGHWLGKLQNLKRVYIRLESTDMDEDGLL